MGDVAKGVKSFKAGLKDDEPIGQRSRSSRAAGGRRPGGQEGRARQQLSRRTLHWSTVDVRHRLVGDGPHPDGRPDRDRTQGSAARRPDHRQMDRQGARHGARVPALDRRHGARGRAAGHQGRDGQAQPGRRPPPHRGDDRPGGRAAPQPGGAGRLPSLRDQDYGEPDSARAARAAGPAPAAARRSAPACCRQPDRRRRRLRRRTRTADGAHQGHRRARDAAARPSGRAAQPA